MLGPAPYLDQIVGDAQHGVLHNSPLQHARSPRDEHLGFMAKDPLRFPPDPGVEAARAPDPARTTPMPPSATRRKTIIPLAWPALAR